MTTRTTGSNPRGRPRRQRSGSGGSGRNGAIRERIGVAGFNRFLDPVFSAAYRFHVHPFTTRFEPYADV